VDISDPLNPLEITCLDLGDSIKKLPGRILVEPPLDIKVVEDYAYITCNNSFYIIDISDKADPAAVGYMAIGGTDLDVGGNYAFVLGQNSGLHVFDVSDPTKPAEVCFYPLKSDNGRIGLSQITTDPDLTHAYIAAWYDGILIIDISDPLNPVLISSFDTPNYVRYGVIKNDLIYITDYDALRIINVSSPERPVEIKSFIVPFDAKLPDLHCLAVDNDYVYVGTSAGLAIFGYKNQ
jgi:hypothetical protein